MEGHHEVNRIQDRQSLQVHPFSLRHRSLCEFMRWLWRKRKSFSLHQMIQCLLQATEVSNSVGKADNDCTLILFSFRASLEFKKECVQCSLFKMSVVEGNEGVQGHEGVQERRKGRQRLQNDPFTLDQIII